MTASRLRRTIADKEDDRKLDMSPMIDMVFLLLIFFIVNATAITVRTDPEVKPPAASNGVSGLTEGRIVVNVRSDGTYTAEDLSILANEDAVRAYVQEARGKIEKRSISPSLYLRGDKGALFKHGRIVVRAAAQAGVKQVLFAAFGRER